MNRARVGALAAFGAILGVGVYGLMGGTTPIGTAIELAAWPQGRADAPFCVYSLGQTVSCVWADGGTTNILPDGGQGTITPATYWRDAGAGSIVSLSDTSVLLDANGLTMLNIDGGVLFNVGRDGSIDYNVFPPNQAFGVDPQGNVFVKDTNASGVYHGPGLANTAVIALQNTEKISLSQTNSADFIQGDSTGHVYVGAALQAPSVDAGTIIAGQVCLSGTCNSSWPASIVPTSPSSPQQGLQHGSVSLSAGAASVTFSPPFGGSPDCTCTDKSADSPVQCSATTTTLSVAGTLSDSVSWICIGSK